MSGSSTIQAIMRIQKPARRQASLGPSSPKIADCGCRFVVNLQTETAIPLSTPEHQLPFRGKSQASCRSEILSAFRVLPFRKNVAADFSIHRLGCADYQAQKSQRSLGSKTTDHHPRLGRKPIVLRLCLVSTDSQSDGACKVEIGR